MVFLFGVFIFTLPALYNGYPFVDWDSGTYIGSGMTPFIPNDRPSVYGWLIIRKSSWFSTLWLVVLFQNSVLLYVLWKFLKHFFAITLKSYLIIITFLTIFSSIAWYSNQIMPDVFTPMLGLATIFILTKPTIKIPEMVLFILIIAIATAVHNANVWILVSIIVGAIFIHFIAFKLLITRIIHLSIAIFLGIIITLSINYKIEKRIIYTKGAHVFLMGRLLDTGILEKYLSEEESAQKFSFYQFKDSLTNYTSRNFLFDYNSPMHKAGGWEATKPEYSKIIVDVVSKPTYAILFVKNAVISTFSQLLQNSFEIPTDIAFKSVECPPMNEISKFFKSEKRAYMFSRQAFNLWGQTIDFSLLNVATTFSFYFSGLCIVLMLIKLRDISLIIPANQLKGFVLILLIVVANAFVTATLASVCYRFQARISWLIPTYLFVMIFLNFKAIKKYILTSIV